jgi:undecaprenyl diphosphate synthase
MDGNGRWAKKRLLNRIKGHEKGADTVRTIVRTCRQIGIRNLTLYAFSTENWQRPKSEIQALMSLLVKFLDSELKEMMDNNIRLDTIGEIERLPQKVQETLLKTMDVTRVNDGMRLILALSYGSRAEIVSMAQALAQKASTGAIEPDVINDELVSQHLYTSDIPDPDLLIRTSGEMRLSNFLLWQIAYTEIYVTDTLWPDFGKEEFLHILKEFQQRERRYGKIGE